MAGMTVSDQTFVFTCGEKVLTVSDSSDSVNVLEHPCLVNKAPSTAEHEDEIKQEPKDFTPRILCVNLSRCSKWLAVCSSNKQLSVWSTNTWTLLSSRTLIRIASKIKFTPSGNSLIVADKSGDAYLYSVESPRAAGQFLLGHLSLLLDVTITLDEKFIITCDRDEKIRVSRFPNAYNIQSFCLGHAEFVSCVELLPHCPSVLVSSSGDGTVRFWNYLNGKQLCLIDCDQDISNHGSGNFSKLDNAEIPGKNNFDSDGNRNVLAVTCFSSCALNNYSSLVAACIATFDSVAVYKVVGEMSNLSGNLLEIVCVGVEPWTIMLRDMVLWCLAAKEKQPLTVFRFNSNMLHFTPLQENSVDKSLQGTVRMINDKWELFKDLKAPSLTPMLYKRSVDDIQDYLERKKLRLNSSKS